MKYNLLIIDVDGTLVGRDGNISKRDREAIFKVLRSDIKISLSTGRVPQACLKILGELSLDGVHIFFDGALVGEPAGKEIYAQPLRPETVKMAVEFSRLNDIYLELYSATQYYVERETQSTKVHRDFFGITPTLADFTNIWERERIIKGELFVSSPEEDAQVQSFELRFAGSLRLSRASTPAYPGVYFVNVVDPSVSKGRAVEELASYLGIPLSQTVAIGDGINDIPLLRTAGLAIAMGNAPGEVKAIADHITLDVEHGGLAAAIEGIFAGTL